MVVHKENPTRPESVANIGFLEDSAESLPLSAIIQASEIRLPSSASRVPGRRPGTDGRPGGGACIVGLAQDERPFGPQPVKSGYRMYWSHPP